MKQDITSLFCFVDDFVQGIQEEIKRHTLEASQKTKKTYTLPWFARK